MSVLGAVVTCCLAAAAPSPGADLILTGGRVWTGDPERPWAEALAVAGERIVAVGGPAAVMAHRRAATRVVELSGAFVAPGFIDNHTHFD
ncbi:MAG TPA: hypothetical protein VMR44_00325, partial [Thermoanaerobaculia bacterium]|nr:hypothetical protein [Thermoanaerobaculia bacterium]HUP43153.1 hypothetical protein [Thermoanaerobaculia bacterium]